MAPARFTRRNVLSGLAASLSGVLLAATTGCSAPSASTAVPPLPPTPNTPTPAATPATAAKSAVLSTPGATSPAITPTSQPAGGIAITVKVEGPADVAVVKGASPAEITRAAVQAIGGIGRFVKAGQTVVVKPNVCTALAPEYGATTNPEVVAALIEMCRSAGAAKVKVLDYAWGSNTTGYAVSGIEAAVKQAGGEIVPITPLKWKKTEFPKAKNLKSQEVYEDVLTADVLINVPIAKNHGLSTLTLGMKNLMGVVRSREVYHSAFGRNLTDLATMIRPAFTLVDAVRIMTRNGPGGGSLDYVEKRDTVIASTDIVAVDAYATTLFGFKPDKLESVRQGQADGLGTYDLSSLKVAEIKL